MRENEKAAHPENSRRHGPAKVILVYILAVLLVVAVATAAYLLVSGRGSGKLEKALAEARERGVALDYNQYWERVRTVQHSGNAADYYEPAVALAAAALQSQSSNSLEGLPPLRSPQVKFPPLGKPVPDGLKEKVAEFVASQRELLALLHEGARFQHCEYDIDWQGPATLLPHLARIRACAKILALAAWNKAVDGDAPGAVEVVRDGVALSGSLADEPALISRLVRFACYSMAMTGLGEVLARTEPDMALLAKLQGELSAAAERISLASAYEGELISLLCIREEARRGGVSGIKSFLGSMGSMAGPAGRSSPVTSFDALKAWWRLGDDIAFGVRGCLALIDAASHPSPEVLAKASSGEILAELQDPRYRLSQMLLPALPKSLVSAENARATLRAAAAALAALRFAKEMGNWPDSLEGLVPAYLQKVLPDPFTERPLLYRVLPDGIVVYSVGVNGIDDGGPSLDGQGERGESKSDDAGFRLWRAPGADPLDATALIDLEDSFGWRVELGGDFERAVLEAGDLGIPVTFEELAAMIGEIPDEENAALIYKKAFKLFVSGDWEWVQKLPIVGLAKPPEDPAEPLPAEMLEAIRKYIAPNAEAIELLRQGAALERAAYSIEWNGYETPLPHLSRAREGARILALAAWLEAEDGNADAAVGRVRDALALSESLGGEPWVISQLVSFAGRSIAVTTALERVLARCTPSDGSLAGLQEQLSRGAQGISPQTGLLGEISAYVDICRRLEAGDYDILKTMFAYRGTALSDADRMLVTAQLRENSAAGLRFLLELYRAAAKPAPEYFKPMQEMPAAMAAHRRGSPLLSAYTFLPRHLGNTEKSRARMRAAAAGVAAARYRSATGRWPASLDSLVPQYLDSAPVDPLTGSTLFYAVRDEGILVYSAGEGAGAAAPPDFSTPSGTFASEYCGFRLRNTPP